MLKLDSRGWLDGSDFPASYPESSALSLSCLVHSLPLDGMKTLI